MKNLLVKFLRYLTEDEEQKAIEQPEQRQEIEQEYTQKQKLKKNNP